MALTKRSKRSAYTPFGSPYSGLSPQPIASDRNPTSNDTAELGTLWINKSSNDAYVITSIVAGAANWESLGGGAITIAGDSGSTTAASFTFDGTQRMVFTMSSGTMTLSYTGIDLPAATAGGNGAIYISGTRLLSAYGAVAESNIFVGPFSGNFTNTSAGNTGIGRQALRNITSGGNNTVLGADSGTAITEGTNNVLIGTNVASSLVDGDYNIYIGSGAGGTSDPDANSNIYLNTNGQAGESHVLRIGDDTGLGIQNLAKAFISGIFGITTDVNDAIPVLIDSAGQLGTVSSSERYKQNIADLGADSELIYGLRPVSFEYKSRPGVYESGLIAEEVEQVMPRLVVYNKEGKPETVKYHELSVLLLNELQRLEKRVAELEERLAR